MTEALFGTTVGRRAYQDDQNKLQELAIRQQTSDAGVRLANAQAANLDADNQRADSVERRAVAEVKHKEQEAKNAERMREALGRLGRGEPADGSAPTKPVLAGGSVFDASISRGMAQVEYLRDSGDVKGANDAFAKLAEGTKDLAAARASASQDVENVYGAAAKRHEGVAKIMSGVVDQASYDAASLQLRGSNFMSEADMKEWPARYAPQFVRSVVAGSAAEKQRADIAREGARSSMQNANDADLIKSRKLAQSLADKSHTLEVAREARLKKQGEARIAALGGKKPPGAPSPREIEAISAELKRLGVKVEKDMTPAMQSDLVEEVRERLRNGANGWGGATATVVAEMKADGRLKESLVGRDEYLPDGKTKGRPLPFPATPAELKEGYYTHGGEVRYFDGAKWVREPAQGAGK